MFVTARKGMVQCNESILRNRYCSEEVFREISVTGMNMNISITLVIIQIKWATSSVRAVCATFAIPVLLIVVKRRCD